MATPQKSNSHVVDVPTDAGSLFNVDKEKLMQLTKNKDHVILRDWWCRWNHFSLKTHDHYGIRGTLLISTAASNFLNPTLTKSEALLLGACWLHCTPSKTWTPLSNINLNVGAYFVKAVRGSQLVVVLRNGLKQHIPVSSVLVGDVVLLHTGDEVPSDGLVLEAYGDQATKNISSEQHTGIPIGSTDMGEYKNGSNRVSDFREAAIVFGYVASESTRRAKGSEIYYRHMSRNIMTQSAYQIVVVSVLQFRGSTIFGFTHGEVDTTTFVLPIFLQVNMIIERKIEEKNIFSGIRPHFIWIIAGLMVAPFVLVKILGGSSETGLGTLGNMRCNRLFLGLSVSSSNSCLSDSSWHPTAWLLL
ncbi:calcium-transporting ATPase 13, plasma membrane-type [Dorcoceras hygrometricum]|uniref:Calcium-transporting ATPase 13, plasma membrane-type n=1 Tax=Dorcoceras hygrometricum TaxID=472368 RepID=A0A2Z7AX19_9LAMI|nr:calcium-transporting ATPase 13, plasma membrane-type [Dorcoceras hygrometricum]